MDVLVVDCQATGASPAFGHVLEMGWGVVRGDSGPRGFEAHWIALPEGHTVPGQVRELTGWEPAAAADAIAGHEAWRRLRAAVAQAEPVPTAIHYARFELSFLRDWSARFEPDVAFPLDAVCLHAIASRLYSALPRLSLRALAGYLGHSVSLQRRALGHVEATAFVWQRLCGDLAALGVETWEDLQAWLRQRGPARARPKKPTYPIDERRFRSLPDAPGVYRFLRRNGDLLYVGKATSLKKRVTSHFIARSGKLLAPEMLTQVSDIAVTETASALEAALLENETIKALNPPYNVQLTTGDPRVWYSNAAFDAAEAAPSDEHAIGPLPSEYALRPLGALSALLAGASPELPVRAHAVGVSALWTPDEPVFTAGWSELMARHAAAAGLPEEAARTRALQLARHLLAVVAAQKDPPRDEEESDRTWDPPRVARHIERAAAQAYRVYRRTRWLKLLDDAEVAFQEPGATRTRRLRIRAGQVSAVDADDTPPALAAPPDAPFDRASYDRLRILTTELKRIARDGGTVLVRVRGARALPARLLPGVFVAI
ncbi:MAG TPA: GIY-YIG nuclease family protein [Polyangia bacterium]|nr:GIY-YIG nuclease family protein [Polyangia bacterium]